MKTKKNLKMPKPRNPFVQHLINRKQGVFKDKMPTRAEIKASLRKEDYSDKFTIYPSSLYGPLVEWFNVGFLIPVPGFDSQGVHQ